VRKSLFIVFLQGETDETMSHFERRMFELDEGFKELGDLLKGF
jgi:hypothetical protein